MTDLSQFCAPNTTCMEEYVPVSNGVELRVFKFFPEQKKGHPTVVFVPGWITQLFAWKKVLHEMSKDFPIIYIETREKISAKIKGRINYGVEDISQDIVHIMNTSGFKHHQYMLVGSSLGATVLLNCCQHLKVKPLCLVLIGPNAEFRVPRFGMAIIRVFYPPLFFGLKPVVKWYLKNFRLDVKTDVAQYKKYCQNLDAANPWRLKKAVIPFSKYEVWDVLDTIQYPSLVVGASKDKLHEPANLAKIVSRLQHAIFIDLETNEYTHSEILVEEMIKYIQNLPNFNCSCSRCKMAKEKSYELK